MTPTNEDVVPGKKAPMMEAPYWRNSGQHRVKGDDVHSVSLRRFQGKRRIRSIVGCSKKPSGPLTR